MDNQNQVPKENRKSADMLSPLPGQKKGKQSIGFVDNRPAATRMNKLKSMVNNRPATGQLKALQKNSGGSPAAGSIVLQRLKKIATDPMAIGSAVGVRNSIGDSRKCVGAGKIKTGGAWSEQITDVSSGTAGPQGHAERVVLDRFVKGIQIRHSKQQPFGRQLNVEEGNQAGELLKANNVTDVDMYTELPPCWGCDPWIEQIDKKIDGEVVSRHSILLDNYYDHYNMLKAHVFPGRNGTNVLQDYHINNVNGNMYNAKRDFELLKSRGYIANASPASHPGLLEQNRDTLEEIAFAHYENLKLKGMEINNNDKYISRLRTILERIGKTSDYDILYLFDAIKESTTKEVKEAVDWANADYERIQNIISQDEEMGLPEDEEMSQQEEDEMVEMD